MTVTTNEGAGSNPTREEKPAQFAYLDCPGIAQPRGIDRYGQQSCEWPDGSRFSVPRPNQGHQRYYPPQGGGVWIIPIPVPMPQRPHPQRHPPQRHSPHRRGELETAPSPVAELGTPPAVLADALAKGVTSESAAMGAESTVPSVPRAKGAHSVA